MVVIHTTVITDGHAIVDTEVIKEGAPPRRGLCQLWKRAGEWSRFSGSDTTDWFPAEFQGIPYDDIQAIGSTLERLLNGD